MEAVYIQFETKDFGTGRAPLNLFQKFVKFTLTKIIPVANPDFEGKIDDVKFWMLECDAEGIPEREIGLDMEKQVVLKMPYRKNYGYWTDNNMVLEDFKRQFHATEITKDTFEQFWKTLL